jgi:hypothetical protein
MKNVDFRMSIEGSALRAGDDVGGGTAVVFRQVVVRHFTTTVMSLAAHKPPSCASARTT